MKAEVIVIGAGAAGLFTALSLAPKEVIVLSETAAGGDCASLWSQGGFAAAVGAGDTPRNHADDTLMAAAGTADAEVVRILTAEAPAAVKMLETFGARFAHANGGAFSLGREACHAQKRIVRADAGDGFGRELMRTLLAAALNTPSITFVQAAAEQLIENDGRIQGVAARLADGNTAIFAAPAIVLATGGLGGLYAATTNPLASVGRGIALAARAGATLSDLEFVQFHPTALDVGPARLRDTEFSPMPLASEALRGEGAHLVNTNGERFVDELAPRDAVSRALFAQQRRGQKTFLDCRHIDTANFPALLNACAGAGIDPRHEPVPVTPAAHYHMGGVATDIHGRTSLRGLWACGEVAATGLHGANRLASNSLMEAIVMGARVATDITKSKLVLNKTAPLQAELPPHTGAKMAQRTLLRQIMTGRAGVIRDRISLTAALREIESIDAEGDTLLADMILTARLIVTAALQRKESRGAHWRSDYPATLPGWQKRSFMTSEKTDGLLPARRREPAA